MRSEAVGQQNNDNKRRKRLLQGLEPKAKLRYKEKIDLSSNCDPYTIKKDEMMTEIENFPSISYPDIVNYLLFALSPLTNEELKAYQGLESNNQFVPGWVKWQSSYDRAGKYILSYQSQLLSPVSYIVGITINS